MGEAEVMEGLGFKSFDDVLLYAKKYDWRVHAGVTKRYDSVVHYFVTPQGNRIQCAVYSDGHVSF